MIEKSIEFWVETLSKCSLPNGGFSGQSGGHYRPDATAWTALALAAVRAREDLVQSARSRLASDQMKDGRVTVSPDDPEAFWPTPLAILAWHGSPAHAEPQSRAVKFLLATAGRHFEKKDDSILGHNTMIRGWPWIRDTHSWVEPTSMALLALELTGNGDHERAREARRMLLDRQLEYGGWNYGNTVVFGQQLRPMAMSTGMALNTLATRVPRQSVEKSLLYLNDRVSRLYTPLSLGWSLLGLGAWRERHIDAQNCVFQCLERQETYGPYDTLQLSLLLISLLGERGLLNLVA